MALRILKQLEAEEWASKAEKYLPKSILIHGYLSIGLKRNIFNLNEIKFYVPKNDKLPFFMIITGVTGRDVLNCTLFWIPEEFEEGVLLDLLTSIPNWNWQNEMFFYLSHSAALQQLERFILRPDKGLGNGKLMRCPNYSHDGNAFTIKNTDKIKYKYPEDEYVLDFVHDDCAEYIHGHWLYQNFFALSLVRQTLQVMPAIGAYVKQPGLDHRSSKPVSWAIAKHDGQIGMTNTLLDHRGKGLGGAVTLKLVEILLEQNVTPYVVLEINNALSLKFHEGLGFEKVSETLLGCHEYKAIPEK